MAKRGEVTLREGDLGGQLAGFSQHDDVSAAIDYRLSDEQWRETVDHECRHLLQGPVPVEMIQADEVWVRAETAAALFPVGAALAELGHQLSDAEVAQFARLYGAPPAVVRDGVNQPAAPPSQIPWPRAADGDAA